MTRCIHCRTPAATYLCRKCRRLRARTVYIHGPRRYVAMADPGREVRIREFTALASARRPLFAGHR